MKQVTHGHRHVIFIRCLDFPSHIHGSYGQGKSGSFKKSGKVMESQVKWRGSGKDREFYNSC